jgi:hypothetical protein
MGEEPVMTRGEDIARVAESLGLGYREAMSSTEFDTRDAPSWAEGLWENVMIGTHEGSEVVAFDWAGWAWAGAGAHSMGAPVKSLLASCALTQLPSSVPLLKVIAPKRLKPWGRVRLGDGRFDRLFRIETRDKSFAQALLHPGMRALLLGPDKDASWLRLSDGSVSFELQGRWLACNTPLLEPERIREDLLEPLTRFRVQIPQSVFEQYGLSG